MGFAPLVVLLAGSEWEFVFSFVLFLVVIAVVLVGCESGCSEEKAGRNQKAR